MAITQVGSATTATESGTLSSVTVTKPTGVASGDVLIAFGASNKVGWTIPSGFTQFVISTDANAPNAFRAYGWYKVCGGSEPANYTFTKSTINDGAPVVVTMSAWRGVDNVSPIANSSTETGGTSAEPSNPATSFSQTVQGRLMFMRAARRVSSTSSVADVPTFSNGTAAWSEISDVGQFSGGTVNYAIGTYVSDVDTGAGSRSEPSITCSNAESDNVFFLLALQAAPGGDFDGTTLPSMTSAFAGTMTTPSGTHDVSLPPMTSGFAGMGAPPDGPMDATLPSMTSALAGVSIGGSVGTTLPSMTSALVGAVNPIGSVDAQLPSLSPALVMETRPFGEHIIRVDAESRAFLVVDEDPGLIAIDRSQVTQL